MDGTDGETYTGILKSAGPKFGFLTFTCPVAREKFGDDIFVPAAGLQGISMGGKVDFGVRINATTGKPEAVNARRSGINATTGEPDGTDGETYIGKLKTAGPQYGFI